MTIGTFYPAASADDGHVESGGYERRGFDSHLERLGDFYHIIGRSIEWAG